MDKSYLLDTNIVMAYFNLEASVRRHLKGDVLFYVSTIVAGEILHGIFNSTSQQRNLAAMREFLAVQTLLETDLATAEFYGLLATQLGQRGLPIRDNDIWIAAHALQHNLIMVPLGLQVEIW